jgi:hypothetical protein
LVRACSLLQKWCLPVGLSHRELLLYVLIPFLRVEPPGLNHFADPTSEHFHTGVVVPMHESEREKTFFCVWYWGLNSGPTPCATPPAPFCDGFFQDRVLRNYLPRLASNHDPPGLCLLSSWDYRCEPLAPGEDSRNLEAASFCSVPLSSLLTKLSIMPTSWEVMSQCHGQGNERWSGADRHRAGHRHTHHVPYLFEVCQW